MQLEWDVAIKDLKNIALQKGLREINDVLTNHASILQVNTMEESLHLLSPTLSKNITHPLYKLLTQPLGNNDSKIAFLKRAMNLAEKKKKEKVFLKEHLASVKTMMGRVMDSLPWDDWYARDKVQPIVSAMMKSKDFADVVHEHGREIEIRDLDWDQTVELVGLCKKLAYLNVHDSKNITGTINLPASFEQLKELNLAHSSIQGIEGFENVSRLEDLFLWGTANLTSFILKEDMLALKYLDLHGSAVSKVGGWEHMPNLKTLDLRNTKKLTSLTFAKHETEEAIRALKNLKIYFERSGITKSTQINGYDYLDKGNVEWR